METEAILIPDDVVKESKEPKQSEVVVINQ